MSIGKRYLEYLTVYSFFAAAACVVRRICDCVTRHRIEKRSIMGLMNDSLR